MPDSVAVNIDSTTTTEYAWSSETSATPFIGLGDFVLAGPIWPTVIPDDEVFFWTPSWQEAERASMQALTEGRSRRFATADEAIRYLFRTED